MEGAIEKTLNKLLLVAPQEDLPTKEEVAEVLREGIRECASKAEKESSVLASKIWLRISAMLDEADPGVQQLTATFLCRELSQLIISINHKFTEKE